MKKLFALLSMFYLTCSNSSQTAGVSIDEDTGTISGKLVYSDSLPVSDVQVRLHMKKSGGTGNNTRIWEISGMRKSDNAGMFNFDSLHEGEYTIEAIGEYAGDLDTFIIQSPDTFHLRLTMQALGGIEGTVDPTILNRYSSLSVVIPEINRSVRVDTGGIFLFQNLAPFTYTVRLKVDDTLLTAPGCTQTVVVGPWSKVCIDRLGETDTTETINAPQIPGNFRAKRVSEQTISLQWAASQNNSRYILYRYDEDSGIFDTIYHGVNTVVADSNLDPGNSYTYFVRAENSAGISEKSAALTAMIGTQQQNETISISIAAPLHNSVYLTGDSIYFATTAIDNNESILKMIVSIDNVSFDSSVISTYNGMMAPLPKGKHYFRVIAMTQNGDSVFSAPIRLFVEEKLTGDVNSDGIVDDNDALDVARFTTGIQLLHFDEDAADVDCNGNILITDALLIARFYKEIIDTLPCLGQ